MGSEWHVTHLGELGEVNRGRSRHRPRNAPHLYGGEYPFIQTGDIKASNGLITAHSQTYSEAGLAQSRIWPEGTMVITIAANIAETAILTYPACFPDSVVGFIADKRKADVRFIEFLFRHLRRQIQHENVGTGSVQDNINLQTLDRLALRVPPLPEQRAIAHILGTLDDKIELNRKRNETLEDMARALFKDWFVDFSPVRAKMEGREPYLPAEIWDLFPDRLDEEGKPEGWGVCPLSELLTIIGGGTPKTSVTEYWNGEIPWFSVVDTPPSSDLFVVTTEKSITEEGLERSSARLVPKGTTIITARGTVGNLAIASRDMTFNQSCYGLRGNLGIGDNFVYLTALGMVDQLKSMSHGSVFSTITRQTFEAIRRPIPSSLILSAFEGLVIPWFDTILSNVEESRTLAQLRDTLLPKLISGEVRVGDVDRFIDRALQGESV